MNLQPTQLPGTSMAAPAPVTTCASPRCSFCPSPLPRPRPRSHLRQPPLQLLPEPRREQRLPPRERPHQGLPRGEGGEARAQGPLADKGGEQPLHHLQG